VRTRIQAIVIPSEDADFRDELARVFQELGKTTGLGALSGECSPALDVFETDHTVEIVVDLPGVDRSAVRVLIKDRAVLVAGEKTPRRRGESSFHLVERGYGRFARTVRLASPCDTANARASLSNGELHLSLPKIVERRSRTITIPVTAGPPVA
jgi:HSP20 family protein